MRETDHMGVIHKPEATELSYVTFDEIPGRSTEEKQQWLIDHKSHASRPRKFWSSLDLARRFPNGAWDDDFFSDSDSTMQRFFNRNGYEIERRKFSSIITDALHIFHIVERHISEHDNEGYLEKISHFGIAPHLGFTRWFEYESLPSGEKALTRSITQEFFRNGLLMEPGRLSGQPYVIDLFTQVPLIHEKPDYQSDDFDL